MNDKANRDLFLFTNEYPYGTGETFIENELTQHLQYFKSITIFPLNKKAGVRILDPRITVVYLFENQPYIPEKLIIRYFFHFFGIFIRECYSAGLTRNFFKQLPALKSILLQNFHRANLLQNYLNKIGDLKSTILYSFWTDDWATVLSILKEKKQIHCFVSRVHGYDLFKERWPDSIIPFRAFQLKNVSKIFAVSKAGLNYLRQQYPNYQNKFFLNHLSVSDNGAGPFADKVIFTVVSCSNLIPLKRVHLIAEALCHIKFELKWVHFGDGVEQNNILNIVKKIQGNIKVELKGNVSNAALLHFYKENTVHVFVHLSETEGGVPLALQEAASFGIPLIGSVAGGTAEIINERTGIPLPVDIDPVQLSLLLDNFRNGPKSTVQFRNEVRMFWKQAFSSDGNYSKLYKEITGESINVNRNE
jgi:glycosyltransferase involved in cell wall biosynthesis